MYLNNSEKVSKAQFTPAYEKLSPYIFNVDNKKNYPKGKTKSRVLTDFNYLTRHFLSLTCVNVLPDDKTNYRL